MPRLFHRGDRLGLLFVGDELGLLRALPARLRAYLTDPDFQHRVTARLFPPAYEEAEANEEYMAYTRDDLCSHKLEQVQEFEASLDQVKRTLAGHLLLLDEPLFATWLGFINDMRLTLGTDLNINDNEWLQRQADDAYDERIVLYEFLSYLQESLLQGWAELD